MRLVQPSDQSDVGARVTQRSDLHPHPCGTTDVRHDELDAHALCFSPTGHALLSAARRFVRSTQNFAILRLRPVAVAGTARCKPQPIRRAANAALRGVLECQ